MSQYNQNDQKVNTQFNAGRDQIINNLVLVGQFLDFTKIEGLIPKSSAPTDFSSIVDAFEKTFSSRVEADLAQSAAFAGEILRSAVTTWTPTKPFQVLPIRNILEDTPRIVVQKLEQLNYWNAYCEWGGTYTTFMRLHSLSLLWNKHFKEEKVWGIRQHSSSSPDYHFVYSESKAKDWGTHSYLDISSITYDKFRVIMAGLVIDLMRIHTLGSDDVKFWNGIVKLISK